MLLGGYTNVLIGLSLVFGALAMAVSAISESVNTHFKVRSNILLRGLQKLFNAPTAGGWKENEILLQPFVSPRLFVPATSNSSVKDVNARLLLDLLGHASVNPLAEQLYDATKQPENTTIPPNSRPSYLAADQFALAFYDVLIALGQGTTMAAALPQVKDPQLSAFLSGIFRSAGEDKGKWLQALGDWFDSAMDRLSGEFKRYVRIVSFLLAFGLAAGINVDAISIMHAIVTDPALAQSVPTTQPISPTDALARISTAGLPIGWKDGRPVSWHHPEPSPPLKWPRRLWLSLSTVLGWTMTAFAAQLGAPFWFDLLQKFVQLRGTGAKPTAAKAG